MRMRVFCYGAASTPPFVTAFLLVLISGSPKTSGFLGVGAEFVYAYCDTADPVDRMRFVNYFCIRSYDSAHRVNQLAVWSNFQNRGAVQGSHNDRHLCCFRLNRLHPSV